MRERFFALDFIRAAAILCVLLAHAWYARFPGGAVDGSRAAAVMLVSFLFCQGATGLFVLVSGALILPKERREGFPLLWRRVLGFVLLAGFWSVVTNACGYVAEEWPVSAALAQSVRYHSLIVGGWAYRAGYLWFLSVIVSLYLAAPFLARLAYAMPRRGYLLFAGISCLLYPLPGTLDVGGQGRSFLNPDTMVTFGGYDVFGVFASWFLLGHLFWSVDVRALAERYTRHYCLWLCGLLAAVTGGGGAMELYLTGARAIYAPLHLFRPSLPIFLVAPLLFLLLKEMAPWFGRRRWRVWVTRLARHSFGIYLSHFGLLWLLLSFLERHGLGPACHSLLPVGLAFALSLAGSWGLTALLFRWRWLRWLVH